MEFEGVTYISEALIDVEETVAEWEIFKRAVVMERDVMMQKKKLTKPPTLHELKVEMTYATVSFQTVKASGHSVDIACWNSYSRTFFQSDEDGEDTTTCTFQAE